MTSEVGKESNMIDAPQLEPIHLIINTTSHIKSTSLRRKKKLGKTSYKLICKSTASN